MMWLLQPYVIKGIAPKRLSKFATVFELQHIEVFFLYWVVFGCLYIGYLDACIGYLDARIGYLNARVG